MSSICSLLKEIRNLHRNFPSHSSSTLPLLSLSVPSLPPPSVGTGAGVAGVGTGTASKSLTYTNNYEAKSE